MTRADYRRRLKGRRMYVGMDLSSTKDLTALVGVLPDDDGPGFDTLAQFFVPQDNMRERVTRDRVPYDKWAKQGFLIPTPGNVVDYEAVRRQLLDWADEFEVKTVAFDKFNATYLVTRLKELDGFECVQTGQGFLSLSSSTKALEKHILARTLRHDGHPVLRWCVSNVSIVADEYGNLRISKKASSEKIDGVAALIMAVDQMERNTVVKPPEYSMVVLGGR
jgi:phage terminase large subunit-like protein